MQVITRTSRRFTRGLARGVRVSVALACGASISLAAACASSGSSASGGPKPGPNLITADEISRVNVVNAYEVVQKLRPAMFRQRQVASANAQANGELVIYVDNNRFGDVDSLRQISASSIAALRYYSASEAQTKWGSGHPGGAIEVVTKR
jgi:hypothetical protein